MTENVIQNPIEKRIESSKNKSDIKAILKSLWFIIAGVCIGIGALLIVLGKMSSDDQTLILLLTIVWCAAGIEKSLAKEIQNK